MATITEKQLETIQAIAPRLSKQQASAVIGVLMTFVPKSGDEE